MQLVHGSMYDLETAQVGDQPWLPSLLRERERELGIVRNMLFIQTFAFTLFERQSVFAVKKSVSLAEQ